MQDLIAKLIRDFPELRFTPGEQFCWVPETNEVRYRNNTTNSKAAWSLLHEAGHALLGHKTYKSDVALLRLEVEAWARAQSLGLQYGIKIGEDHIQDCLDTYREWLYKRSICPSCNTKCLQQDNFTHYKCFNCHTTWRVSPNRFCRAYRSTKNVPQASGITI